MERTRLDLLVQTQVVYRRALGSYSFIFRTIWGIASRIHFALFSVAALGKLVEAGLLFVQGFAAHVLKAREALLPSC